MKVLVVEDCEMNAVVITGFLRKHCAEVEINYAENGQIGVDCVEESEYDVVLMDINMPVMDGITATRLIKKNKPNQLVIAVTAVGIDHFKQRNALSTFDQILMKPLNYELFTKTLDSLVAAI